MSGECLPQLYESFDIDGNAWKMIVERSMKDGRSVPDQRYASRYIVKPLPLLYESGKEFQGIVRHLTQKTGGNIHRNGTIEVCSNEYQSESEPWNLLDFDGNNYYCASSQWDVWICYDFKERKVKVTNYSINSIKQYTGHHLKSWVVEVSDDGNNWTQIDERKDCKKLNLTNLVATFDVKPNDYSRYVRLHNTAEPWGGNNLWFSCLEFYGYIV